MHHRKKGKILGRKKSHRDALIRNQAIAFFRHSKITTTQAKAKVLRSYMEKLITIGKKKNLASLRLIIKKIHSPKTAKKIVDEISPKYQSRPGGYLRIIKLNPRKGDGAKLARLEYVQESDKSK